MNLVYSVNKSTKSEISLHFKKCNKTFLNNLSKKVVLEDYVSKLFDKSIRFEIYDKGLEGLIAAYFNESSSAYITNVSVVDDALRRGIASKLLEKVIEYAKQKKISTIKLEVGKSNFKAIALYKKFGFIFNQETEKTFCMLLTLNKKAFHWKKLGKVFNPCDFKRSWLDEYAQAPATLVFDDFVRVYFSCRPPRDDNGQFVSYSAYVDLDRKNLFNIVNIAKEPIFHLGKKGSFDEFGTYPTSVIKQNNEIWAYYGGWTRCKSVPFTVSIGFAKSINNGETFEKIADGPIISNSLYEPTIVGGPKIRKFNDKFYLFYIAAKQWIMVNDKPEFSSKIRVATSDDGINWIKMNKEIIPSHFHPDESQASPDVFYKNGKYHIFFCYWNPHNFRETKHRKIGYAFSTDLINWTRDDSKVGIDISTESDAYDNEMIAYPHVFELDRKIYMLYLGNEVGRYGFGLAELEGELV